MNKYYENKYAKYKAKYLALKTGQAGGGTKDGDRMNLGINWKPENVDKQEETSSGVGIGGSAEEMENKRYAKELSDSFKGKGYDTENHIMVICRKDENNNEKVYVYEHKNGSYKLLEESNEIIIYNDGGYNKYETVTYFRPQEEIDDHPTIQFLHLFPHKIDRSIVAKLVELVEEENYMYVLVEDHIYNEEYEDDIDP